MVMCHNTNTKYKVQVISKLKYNNQSTEHLAHSTYTTFEHKHCIKTEVSLQSMSHSECLIVQADTLSNRHEILADILVTME